MANASATSCIKNNAESVYSRVLLKISRNGAELGYFVSDKNKKSLTRLFLAREYKLRVGGFAHSSGRVGSTRPLRNRRSELLA